MMAVLATSQAPDSDRHYYDGIYGGSQRRNWHYKDESSCDTAHDCDHRGRRWKRTCWHDRAGYQRGSNGNK